MLLWRMGELPNMTLRLPMDDVLLFTNMGLLGLEVLGLPAVAVRL